MISFKALSILHSSLHRHVLIYLKEQKINSIQSKDLADRAKIKSDKESIQFIITLRDSEFIFEYAILPNQYLPALNRVCQIDFKTNEQKIIFVNWKYT